jgi:hypothetical protein
MKQDPEIHTLSPTAFVNDDGTAAEIRLARLNRIHNCESEFQADFDSLRDRIWSRRTPASCERREAGVDSLVAGNSCDGKYLVPRSDTFSEN